MYFEVLVCSLCDVYVCCPAVRVLFSYLVWMACLCVGPGALPRVTKLSSLELGLVVASPGLVLGLVVTSPGLVSCRGEYVCFCHLTTRG